MLSVLFLQLFIEIVKIVCVNVDYQKENMKEQNKMI